MASVQEKLAESLSVLKDYQDSHGNMIIYLQLKTYATESRCTKGCHAYILRPSE